MWPSRTEKHKVWMRYDLAADGTVSNGKVFADVTAEKEDGLARRHEGGFAGQCLRHAVPAESGYSRPMASTWAPSSRPKTPANCGWGDDGKTLYITARTGLYRIKLAVAGEKLVY